MNTTVTQKGQATIPQKVRQYLGLLPGDKVSFKITAEGVSVEKEQASSDDLYLKSVQSTLSEWDSDEDNNAYNEL